MKVAVSFKLLHQHLYTLLLDTFISLLFDTFIPVLFDNLDQVILKFQTAKRISSVH